MFLVLLHLDGKIFAPRNKLRILGEIFVFATLDGIPPILWISERFRWLTGIFTLATTHQPFGSIETASHGLHISVAEGTQTFTAVFEQVELSSIAETPAEDRTSTLTIGTARGIFTMPFEKKSQS